MESWGNLAIINLYGCNNSIKNKKKIKEFVALLTKEIKMNPVGKTQIKRFGAGKLKGYSAIQFIETSSITIHFDERENRAFIDIFSCMPFNEKKVATFSRKFFKAEKSTAKMMKR